MKKSDGIMTFSADDYRYMASALRLARRGINSTDPNPNVGCIIVAADGGVAGEGWHASAGEAHAEVGALAQAGTHARGATAYVTLEPCSHHGRTPPCADALVTAGVSRVVCAMQDPNPLVAGRGIAQLESAGIAVQSGLLEAGARELNRGFIRRMETGVPWVCVKLAISIDGRTALESGESKWITSPAARADVHRMRARSSAILSGIGTVLTDNPQLNARCDGLAELQQPLRVIADTSLRLPRSASLLQGDSDSAGAVLVYHSGGSPEAVRQLEESGAVVRQLPEVAGHLCLESLLADLGAQGINSVLVEAGAILNGALLRAGLVDELIVYQAAKVMGGNARGMFMLDAVEQMSDSIGLNLVETRRVGADLRLTYRMG
jgi:diaminohydroxyphosphoribosylaminopyrimidine deaminase/5-amino-6-(5-phosphoribosylamino)uracil reductase